MEQVRSGSTDAVWRLIEDYGPHIQRVVRRRLDSRMRSKFDSQDFVQMVWASFFRNPVEMSSFDEPEDLMRYLSAMAQHKVVSEYRRRIVQQKHNVTRERPLNDSHESDEVAKTRDPTPSQFAMIREDWNRKLEGMSDKHQEIVRLRLGGATYTEIAQQVGVHERTARQVVHRVFGE
jgi:RNA polymerase sigma-70 factor (ECF subfamily)